MEPVTSSIDAQALPVRVYYEDTDFSGFVYHASYLRFMERGRTELLRGLAGDQSELHREADGLVFVVRRMEIDYLKPARMDDVLSIVTSTRELRGASMHLHQEVCRDGVVLVRAEVVVACVRAGRAIRLPDALRRALAPATLP
ncbi:tol-pal system-associated acyl-CoA thioesterase [Methylobacterium sp. J-059]|uniref:tol-pal system-associated acyl-CoA thioesterase n=1 Tax=Methylobacterium sp. WL6 TaxID=2603901 RepID=UPI0011CA61E8|nr:MULTISPECIES: tol-pal system-associated acyl-CoA thioesterase [unclassified Methylobacterium]MCJ2037749.1 tol-pal system-associated acyl-CoA thioesterase [Methylobacterium sp. J-059]MCJ2075754.1 tol-pal system-associated acyl-CoA thioesterase [Methylobacterium sp. E-016]TXN65611.1 tol-pal system-associated acyl-CoA thioesterase [Methylobacterium sp. WL6]